MFSCGKVLFSGERHAALRITVQPVSTSSVGGSATLSITAGTTEDSIRYRWVRYPAGGGSPQVVKEETK